MTLSVGEDKIPFNVHVDQLCEASAFFKAAFTSKFKENHEETVRLPEDDETTVDLFVQWLYKEQCEFLSPPFDMTGVYTMLSIKLLVFADKYYIPRLRTHVLETLLAHIHNDEQSYSPASQVIEHAYRNTCPGSGIRRLVTNWVAFDANEYWYMSKKTQALFLRIPEIATDLLITYAKTENDKLDKNDFLGSLPSDYADVVEEED